MPPAAKSQQLIEFKGTTLPVVAVTLRSLQPMELARTASALFGDDAFFDDDAALIDLSSVADASSADWRSITQVLRDHGLHVIGVRGGSDALRQSAAAAGLPTRAAIDRPPRPATAEPPTETVAAAVETPPPAEPMKEPLPSATVADVLPTLFVDRPLRSGQQVYARGANLVVLAAVNAGAEVIADGDIHVYAPLHGRALAGAGGAARARIFCTHFDAELISVAGLYRTFDGGVPADLIGKPAQVRLIDTPGEDTAKLIVEPLKIN
ncbi:MAG TPA: septum site-determining protein MinC [Accumulibacter sp.]|jgi:septum site-determining protein MinC|nr:septum site-determining protein MinC [Accumulibacter sp.]HQC78905.1 septum site-determining protein MinC [Accumulibacter sp.]